MQVQATPFRSPTVVGFLRHLRRHIRGKVLVLWDGGPIHRSNVIKAYLAGGAAKWLRLERLPAYAPELNPDEGVWRHPKGVELRNLPCHDLQELRWELRRAKERLRHKTEVLYSCCRRTGLCSV